MYFVFPQSWQKSIFKHHTGWFSFVVALNKHCNYQYHIERNIMQNTSYCLKQLITLLHPKLPFIRHFIKELQERPETHFDESSCHINTNVLVLSTGQEVAFYSLWVVFSSRSLKGDMVSMIYIGMFLISFCTKSNYARFIATLQNETIKEQQVSLESRNIY